MINPIAFFCLLLVTGTKADVDHSTSDGCNRSAAAGADLGKSTLKMGKGGVPTSSTTSMMETCAAIEKSPWLTAVLYSASALAQGPRTPEHHNALITLL